LGLEKINFFFSKKYNFICTIKVREKNNKYTKYFRNKIRAGSGAKGRENKF